MTAHHRRRRLKVLGVPYPVLLGPSLEQTLQHFVHRGALAPLTAGNFSVQRLALATIVENYNMSKCPEPLIHYMKYLSVIRKSDLLVNEYKHTMALSPEKDKYYTTRGSPFPFEGNGFDFGTITEDKGTTSLPRFFIALSNKEKEEDFMAMKGSKLPQRPKKRPKLMQKCLLMVSPGAWLSDLSHERYEVREKKSSKKRARGLKALSMASDSE
ncbi:Cysteine proteinases superfamily protein [Zea mays]|uniref:Cysteine proteinases superfamily protein n=1 Tax=Zea mays TaxID=4577 RepID=A0A1D6GF68_MAIZE|nr:Cysteine proteinases superfamily protein [Zea mays]|eukprot:XP_020408699.1 uncharacterized protein LOC100216982 isoform X2 [Zea mays]